jgi:DNA-binding ferritin-like protein
MPSTALKHLAKKAKVTPERAEHLWHKAKGIVSAEYPEAAKAELAASADHGGMENLIRNLFMAQRCAHVHHWKVKSLSLHLALGDLYEALIEFADELAEMYMGAYGADIKIAQSDPNHFSEQDPVEFIRQLHDVLKALEKSIPQDGFLVNKYQELQGMVAKTKYKAENLK